MLKFRQIPFPQPFVYSIPIFLGLGLGFLTARGEWLFALALAALAPLAILFSAWPFIGVILWLLFMPLSSALPNPDLVYWGLHRLLVPFTLCITVLPRLAKSNGQARFKLALPELSIALLVMYVFLSILLKSADTRLTMIRFVDQMFIPFCLYLIVRLSILRSVELQILRWTMLFIAASQSAIGFLSFFAAQFLPYAWRPLRWGYAAGSLLNPNVYASVLSFCLPLLFNAAMTIKSGFIKFLFLLTSGVSLLFIFFSMERAAWLAGGLVLLGLFVLYPKIMVRFSLSVGILLILLGEMLFSTRISMMVNRINDQSTVNSRVVVTDAMLQMIQEKPIFGWGYETLNLHIKDYYRSIGRASVIYGLTTSHNTFLTIFVELGLVGFILYLLPGAWLLKTCYPLLWHEIKNNHLLAVIWLGVLGSFVISNFMDMRFFPIGLTYWWMELGLIASLIQQRMKIRGAVFFHQPMQEREV